MARYNATQKWQGIKPPKSEFQRFLTLRHLLQMPISGTFIPLSSQHVLLIESRVWELILPCMHRVLYNLHIYYILYSIVKHYIVLGTSYYVMMYKLLQVNIIYAVMIGLKNECGTFFCFFKQFLLKLYTKYISQRR